MISQQQPASIIAIAATGAVILVLLWIIVRLYRQSSRNKSELSTLQKLLANQEHKLVQAHRMEAVGILSGSIVHNLNNLLAVILGHTRMTMHDLPQDAQVQEELGKVIKAGHMASDLVQEISDFYRHADSARKPADLLPVVHDTLELLRDILPPSVEIEENLDSNCGPVLASTTGVQQILMNLCSNALQSMRNHSGKIIVNLAEIRIEDWQKALPQDLGPGSYLELSVSDDGQGMSPETLERIFESYYSANGRSKMGIGLSTVQRILDEHDGVAILKSQLGTGTCFKIYFPLIAWSVSTFSDNSDTKTDTLAGKIASSEQFGAGNLDETISANDAAPFTSESGAEPRATVLLVDDEEMVAQVVAKGLARLGFRVITHTDGRKALSDFVQTPDLFDIVVTDQIMPHMSGVLLTKKIHSTRPDIPVILITGFRDSFNEQQAREAGVHDFILKPTSHRDLADLIDRALLRQMKGNN